MSNQRLCFFVKHSMLSCPLKIWLMCGSSCCPEKSSIRISELIKFEHVKENRNGRAEEYEYESDQSPDVEVRPIFLVDAALGEVCSALRAVSDIWWMASKVIVTGRTPSLASSNQKGMDDEV